ncbi:hypothetical protein HMPREF0877_1336 [Weissella paramesenteroides ATCC 33313]|uniref:Uncharacterized protein n=1 Tax=Weissella paramesenteroides ATCC 33313 TaxID=585506 RepID=C5RBJ0_WEIPA|nr:hypothetical protein HMPREF0877_1336 [Weissella paramesenteroides ATCC 33313]
MNIQKRIISVGRVMWHDLFFRCIFFRNNCQLNTVDATLITVITALWNLARRDNAVQNSITVLWNKLLIRNHGLQRPLGKWY